MWRHLGELYDRAYTHEPPTDSYSLKSFTGGIDYCSSAEFSCTLGVSNSCYRAWLPQLCDSFVARSERGGYVGVARSNANGLVLLSCKTLAQAMTVNLSGGHVTSTSRVAGPYLHERCKHRLPAYASTILPQ